MFGLTKTCELDPLPAKQIQQCLSSLVPIITAITIKSLEEGTMPSALKVTCVHPLLKKPSLDRDMLCNYPDSTTAAGRGQLEFGKTIGPPSATACGPQEFCPPARVRAEGGSCSAANGVPMVNR